MEEVSRQSMISLLLPVRQDSKYLAKFVMTFLTHTKDFNNVELLIFIDPADTWNKELLEYCKDKVRVIPDTTGKGRGNSHLFYNELAKEAKGDWLWYVCDDHYLFDGYDEYISNYIRDNNLDSNKIEVIAPAVSNSGRISHIVSRRLYETVGFGQHGNVDSYINEMLENVDYLMGYYTLPHTPSGVVMSDFSLDKELFKTKNRDDFDEEEQIALFRSSEMKQKIKEDARKLYDVIKEENAS